MIAIPDRSWYRLGDEVAIEIDDDTAAAGARLVVDRLGETVRESPASGGRVALGAFARGGYGVTVRADDGAVLASTAFDVLDDAFERPRYGFLTTMTADAPHDDVARFYRRLHLNLAQFYDWAYRHSHLLPPSDDYLDPLGQPRSLSAVDAAADAFRAIGTLPLGYSAVYAIGSDETSEWEDAVLRREDGEPYRLGEDFLVLVDPADDRWLAHYTEQLSAVMRSTRLAGFHLDQYGWPKFARTHAGRVDLTHSFRRMLDAVSASVPEARLVFNNVNDFPTWATAGAAQDATYIEVWPPHDTLQDLADLVARSRRLRPEHPPLISAYLSCLTADVEGGIRAAHLTMASVFAAGGTHLLLGEHGSALVDPYYPRNVALPDAEVARLAPWYDFLVRYGDLLLDPALEDVTEFYTGGINEDVVLGGALARTRATPGTVWVRVQRTGDGGHVVHLVNLMGLEEVAWDAAKPPRPELEGLELRVANGLAPAGARWASPDDADASLRDLAGAVRGSVDQTDALSAGQEHIAFRLPPLRTWAMVWLPAA